MELTEDALSTDGCELSDDMSTANDISLELGKLSNKLGVKNSISFKDTSDEQSNMRIHNFQVIRYMQILGIHPALVVDPTHVEYRDSLMKQIKASGKLVQLARLLLDAGILSESDYLCNQEILKQHPEELANAENFYAFLSESYVGDEENVVWNESDTVNHEGGGGSQVDINNILESSDESDFTDERKEDSSNFAEVAPAKKKQKLNPKKIEN